jgi:hypothetical protein
MVNRVRALDRYITSPELAQRLWRRGFRHLSVFEHPWPKSIFFDHTRKSTTRDYSGGAVAFIACLAGQFFENVYRCYAARNHEPAVLENSLYFRHLQNCPSQ